MKTIDICLNTKYSDDYRLNFCKEMKDVTSINIQSKCYLELSFKDDPIIVVILFVIFGIGIIFCILVVYYNCYVRCLKF